MTIHRYLDVLGQGGNHTAWWLFKAMVNAGWTVPMSGSGITGLYATSNVFDMSQSPQKYTSLGPINVGVGSEAWGHRYCWAVLEDPSGNRQVLLMRNNNTGTPGDRYWGLYYSPGGRFGEGQTPGTDWNQEQNAVAPDMQTIWGRTSIIFSDGADAVRSYVAADDTPSPEGEYGFIAMEFRNPNFFSGMFFLDDLRQCPPGQSHSLAIGGVDYADIDPNTTYNYGYFGGNLPRSLSYRDTPFEYFTGCYYCIWYGYARFATPWGGEISADGKEYALPIAVITGDLWNYMGFSRWFRAPSLAHNYPDTGGGELYLFTEALLIVDVLDGLTTPTPV